MTDRRYYADWPPVCNDGWQLRDSLWGAGAASLVHPTDAGPELVLWLPGGAEQPFLFEEAIVVLDSDYRHQPEHPELQLELWRVPGDLSRRPELVAATSWTAGVSSGTEVAVSCGQPCEQTWARCHHLLLRGPWGIGAVAGALTLRRAYVTELTVTPVPGNVQP